MAGNLKILMTADTVGGVWTYALGLCKALLKYDVEIHLLTMGALLTKEQSAQVQQLPNVNLYESNYKLEWMQDCWRDVQLAKQWITAIFSKVKPDLIHFNNYGQTLGSWSCPVITVYHSCVQTWWKAVKGEIPVQDWLRYIETVRNAIAASDVVVAPSKGMLEQARNVNGKFTNAEVIYNGLDIDIKDMPQKAEFILSAGRIWDEGKNIQLLSDIAKEIHWPVCIAGNNIDPDTGEAPKLENVDFLGQLTNEEMQEYMAYAAVFVMPAKYEPFGLAILEAAKSSCALALARLDTLQEIWGDAALYFDPFDEREAKSVIQELVSNDRLRMKMSEKAFERAKKYSAEKMAQNYMQLYEKLLVPMNQTYN
ncbi:glycosyltransferase family 4 protein [Marivirga sp. S37H4]|uniref:Glycosyltransferase family 4 protein n=1 Tax=Marivirga aurantiaca TaxID=2802615 RepID=A0A934WXI8_9BACT|nr:glycosyltransferase family 4 protein [Marivirga aurantiaca]MBK6264978.1 glycosyltransferase family 4 protein [Marivirga aurantiaca]